MINNKKILVTGCYGFIAQHLIYKLLNKNNFIIGVDNKKNYNKIFNINNNNKNYIVLKGDIRNKTFVKKIFKKYKLDICYHLAAITQVLDSNKSPIKTFNTNIIGTINLLENMKNTQPNLKFIFSSSDKAYGETKKLPYKEYSPLNSLNPYDSSKASADIISRTYAKSFGLDICVTRFVNVYGPGDVNWQRIVPGTIKSLINNIKPVLRSDGNYLRDFLYIDDVINGYLLIGKNMILNNDKLRGKAINFGSGKPIKVINIVKKILKIFNKKQNFYIIKNIAINEIKDQYSSYNLANKLIKWSPRISINTGLSKCVKWYVKSFKN